MNAVSPEMAREAAIYEEHAVDRERILRSLASYGSFFQTAIWRAFRERVFARDEYRCVRVIDGERCPNRHASGARLVARHRTYERFGGRERLEDCETVCDSCDHAEPLALPSDGRIKPGTAVHVRRGSFTSVPPTL